MRVLAVDDEEDLLLLYRVTLESAGHEVTVASDGVSGLDEARAGDFELVLLDMMLPGLDGMGVLSALGEEGALEQLPIVIVSARVSIEDQLRGLAAGALQYLTKPFSLDLLRSTVASIGAMDAGERRRLRRDALVRLGGVPDGEALDGQP